MMKKWGMNMLYIYIYIYHLLVLTDSLTTSFRELGLAGTLVRIHYLDYLFMKCL